MFSLLSMIPVIGKLFDTVSTLTNKLGDIKVAMIRATTEQERDRLSAQARELESRRDVLIAQQKTPGGILVTIIQSLMGLAVVVIMWKLVVWDKALGQWTGGHTDKLSPEIWAYIKVVTGFYFVTTWLR